MPWKSETEEDYGDGVGGDGYEDTAFEKFTKSYLYSEFVGGFYDDDVCHGSEDCGVACKGGGRGECKPHGLGIGGVHKG